MARFELSYRTYAYATVVVEAKNRHDAYDMGNRLIDSGAFVNDVLVPKWKEEIPKFEWNMDVEPDVWPTNDPVDDLAGYMLDGERIEGDGYEINVEMEERGLVVHGYVGDCDIDTRWNDLWLPFMEVDRQILELIQEEL